MYLRTQELRDRSLTISFSEQPQAQNLHCHDFLSTGVEELELSTSSPSQYAESTSPEIETKGNRQQRTTSHHCHGSSLFLLFLIVVIGSPVNAYATLVNNGMVIGMSWWALTIIGLVLFVDILCYRQIKDGIGFLTEAIFFTLFGFMFLVISNVTPVILKAFHGDIPWLQISSPEMRAFYGNLASFIIALQSLIIVYVSLRMIWKNKNYNEGGGDPRASRLGIVFQNSGTTDGRNSGGGGGGGDSEKKTTKKKKGGGDECTNKMEMTEFVQVKKRYELFCSYCATCFCLESVAFVERAVGFRSALESVLRRRSKLGKEKEEHEEEEREAKKSEEEEEDEEMDKDDEVICVVSKLQSVLKLKRGYMNLLLQKYSKNKEKRHSPGKYLRETCASLLSVLWSDFIVEGSLNQINISFDARQKLCKIAEDKFSKLQLPNDFVHIMDGAILETWYLLRTVYSSQQFNEFLKKEK